MNAVSDGLHHDGAGLVRDHPVQRRDRELLAERNIDETDLLQQGLCFFEISALAENPRNEFKRRNLIFPIFLRFREVSVSRKIQTGHGKAKLICCIIIERESSADKSHADHCMMRSHGFLSAEWNREISRGDRHRFLIGKFKVQVASEVMIFCLIRCAGTHIECLLPAHFLPGYSW